ncbi:hypothetical protein [Saccharothrix stipae]
MPDLAAWLAFDRHDHGSAAKRYGDAVRYAERAGHPVLAAYMTASLGSVVVEAGSAQQSMTLIDRAAG